MLKIYDKWVQSCVLLLEQGLLYWAPTLRGPILNPFSNPARQIKLYQHNQLRDINVMIDNG